MIRPILVSLCLLSTLSACATDATDETGRDTSVDSALVARGFVGHAKVRGAASSKLHWRSGDPQPALGAERGFMSKAATHELYGICDVLLGKGAWHLTGLTETLDTEWDHMSMLGTRYVVHVDATCSASFTTRRELVDRLFVAAGGPGVDTPENATSFAQDALIALPPTAWRDVGAKLAALPAGSDLFMYGAFNALQSALAWNANRSDVLANVIALATSRVDREAFVGVYALHAFGSAGGIPESRQLEATSGLLDALEVTRDAPLAADAGAGQTLRSYTLNAIANTHPCRVHVDTCFGRPSLAPVNARIVHIAPASLATSARRESAWALAHGGEAALTFAEHELGMRAPAAADGATIVYDMSFYDQREHVSVATLSRALAVGAPVEQRGFVSVLRAIANDATRADAALARTTVDAFCPSHADLCD